MTANTFDHNLARQLLDDGHGITREVWEGKHYIFKKNNFYYSVLVTDEYNRFTLEQSKVVDINTALPQADKEQNEDGDILETPITDYMIYPPAPAYGIKNYA
jgi:hypothetical protein